MVQPETSKNAKKEPEIFKSLIDKSPRPASSFHDDQTQPDALDQKKQTQEKFLKSMLGIEMVIDKVSKLLNQENDEDLWPTDCIRNNKIRKNLSFTKLENSIATNHAYDQDEPIPICTSTTGWHSSNQDSRQSSFDSFGLGITSYFKTLKYFGFLFFVISVLSIPLMIINYSGRGYE